VVVQVVLLWVTTKRVAVAVQVEFITQQRNHLLLVLDTQQLLVQVVLVVLVTLVDQAGLTLHLLH
jgi:hypothetical protein